ncbi:hypothetical protein [Clostridium sardiniense]|uniref:hypothetical protein n=1 Tax=Clostridium sardiniense TaxID=29369 RepID=UPI003D35676B
MAIYCIKERNISRDNSSAKEIILSAGSFECGKDISRGRYTCKAIDGEVGFQVFKEKDTDPEVVDVLNSNGDIGVRTLTFSLDTGDTIIIDNFTPAETKLRDKLTTGIWEVGIDIKPGKYIAKAKDGDGILTIYNNKKYILNVDLDSSGNSGMKQIECTLNKGDIINIGLINEIDFNKE